MKIPHQFQLLGHTFKVKIVPEAEWTDDDSVGFCNYENSTITIVDRLCESRRQQVYCHELVHAILSNMNKQDLNANEEFVDVFGSLLHQILLTSK